MNMAESKRLGFYQKSRRSNKRLIDLFEEIQELRYSSKDEDWKNPRFLKELNSLEGKARVEVLQMLKKGQISTADDFYRAAFLFQHGKNFREYAFAVALAAASKLLGNAWGKNFYAVALDRFLLSVKQPQYFGSQFEMNKDGKWILSSFNQKTSDTERRQYDIPSFKEILETLRQMNDK